MEMRSNIGEVICSSEWMPSIEVESSHGTREVSLSTAHLMNRNVFLKGTIDDNMANDFLSQMLYLEENPVMPVNIYINSHGGQVDAGLMIYDIIQGSKLTINMICTDTAASMAAILLAGGQKGRRSIMEHSKVMIHEPLISNGVGGSATSIRNISDSIMETKNIVNGILAKHTGKSLDEINEATSFDNYMNAKEAIEFGICDKLATSIKVIPYIKK